jgi:hypothetical protein
MQIQVCLGFAKTFFSKRTFWITWLWVMAKLGYPLTDRKESRTWYTLTNSSNDEILLRWAWPLILSLSILFCNHYAQLQRFPPFQSTLFTHHKEPGILQSFKSHFLDCLDSCPYNVNYCNFGNNNAMSIYVWLITYSSTKKHFKKY